jgi:hypothetical protein
MKTTDEAAAHLARTRLGVDDATLRRWERDGLIPTKPASSAQTRRRTQEVRRQAVALIGGASAVAGPPLRSAGGAGASSISVTVRFGVRATRWVAAGGARRAGRVNHAVSARLRPAHR